MLFLRLLCLFFAAACGLQPVRAAQDDIVVVEFTANWCPYCQKLEPAIQALKDNGYPVQQVRLPDEGESPEPVTFGTDNMVLKADSAQAAAEKFGVTQIPRLFVVEKTAAGKLKVTPIRTDQPDALGRLIERAGVRPVPPEEP